MVALKRVVVIGFVIWALVVTGYAWEENTGNQKNGTAIKKSGESGEEYYLIKKSEVVVVTATMSSKELKDCAVSMNVVDKNQIRFSSSASALGILNGLSGIFVNRSGDFGRADADIRGLGQNCRQIAVLVDGKPEKMGLFGCAVSHAFPLDNVERIEVVKGPASVLYGGEALGGAINIFTRLPKEKFEATLTTSYGSFNTRQLNARLGGNLNAFKYYFTADNRHSDGHVDNSGYGGSSVTGKLVYDLSPDSHITLGSKFFDGRKDEPGTVTEPITGLWNDYQRGAVTLNYSGTWNTNEMKVEIYRNFGTHRFSDGWDSRDYTNGAMAHMTIRAINKMELTLGGDIRFFGGKNMGWPSGQWDKSEGSLFAHGEYVLFQRWILSSGVRLQMDSLYGQELCPQVGVVYQAGSHTSVRGLISKGFRSPQLNELYMFPPANPELQPERVWNVEVGVDQDLGRGMRVKANLFHMKGSDMIQTVPNPNGPPPFIFANSGQFSFYGGEVEMDLTLNRHFSGNIAYSYMDHGDYTKGRPGQKANFSLLFMKKRFSGQLSGVYVTDYHAGDFSKERIPAYFLLNTRIIVRLWDNLELLLDMNNILDKQYDIYGEFPGLSAGIYRMPGRNFQVGLRFTPVHAGRRNK